MRLLVIRADVPETFRVTTGGDGFPGDHFEPAVPATGLRPGVDVPAIEPDGHRQIRGGELRPVAGRAVDERGLLLTEAVVEVLGDSKGVAPHARPGRVPVQRQHLGEDRGRQPVGDESSESRFQPKKFRRHPICEQCR